MEFPDSVFLTDDSHKCAVKINYKLGFKHLSVELIKFGQNGSEISEKSYIIFQDFKIRRYISIIFQDYISSIINIKNNYLTELSFHDFNYNLLNNSSLILVFKINNIALNFVLKTIRKLNHYLFRIRKFRFLPIIQRSCNGGLILGFTGNFSFSICHLSY